ncbi:MAG: DUF721 domain-containing protein [Bacteroidetes bacterium]|nr:DUF721 domain-containing protein [Bacteroidota bacterium]
MAQMHIGEALKEFLNKSNLKYGLRAVQIEDVWEEIMGKTIARYTDKIQIIKDTLYIYTSVGALKQELIFQKPKIIQRVNEALKENVIREVIVK